jgi:hypothetical protein
MKRLTRSIRYINIISLFLIIILLIIKLKTAPSLLPTAPSLLPTVHLRPSYLINSSFRNELINERLESYAKMYNTSLVGCDNAQPSNAKQEQDLSAISELLSNLRQQMIPYPNEYFHGRGIVLTVGPQQLKFTKVNLKMIERSGTQLPVQVNLIVSRHTQKRSFFLKNSL